MMMPAARSCVSSFAITTLITKNYVAGIQAAALAAIASAVYNITINFFKGEFSTETFVFSGFVITLIGTKAGISISPLSIVASGIPLALKYPVNEIPIFAIIVV